jgi:hypothetical protein
VIRLRAAFLGAALLALPAAAGAQQRPLETDDAELLPVGRVRSGLGFELLQNRRYSLSGLEGDLARLGISNLQIGVGEYAEFQLSCVIRDYLSVKRRTAAVIPPTFSGDSTSDFGDLVLATKLRLATEKGSRPALAFKFAVELPNASNESGLGNDVTNFFAGMLLAKRVGRARLLGNFGLAILGSPVTANSQSDMFTYGAAVVVPVHNRVSLVADVSGREGTQRIGNEPRGQARFGARIRAAGLLWDVAALAGLHRFDARSGVALGVTYELQAFHKTRTVKTVK